MKNQINHLNEEGKNSSDFQIKEKQISMKQNLSQILGAASFPIKISQKPRSLSIAEDNQKECLS